MNRRQPLTAALSLLVLLALLAPLAAAGLPQTAAATTPGLQPALSDPATNGSLPIHPIAQTIWDAVDGPVARGEVARGWLLGPAPLAMTTERYDDSPTGARRLVYFDKGRLDILDANASPGDYWSAPGGQLVTELLSGSIQLGANRWVRRAPAEIPVAGDPGQPDPVTYATLGRLATLPDGLRKGETPAAVDVRAGSPISAVLAVDGTVEANGYSGPAVRVGGYDDVTGHNIAEPFQTWGDTQVYERLYVLGRPLTEPYWVDTVVGGVARRVLVQAFERRVLTYTPDNPAEWRTESGNAGRHYRAWRGLSAPADPALAPLVSTIPFGEELVAAAQVAGIDPYLLAAVAEVSSSGDPFVRTAGNRRGLLGVRSEIAPTNDDPAANATTGARELSRLLSTTGDERAALAAYHGGTSDPAATFVEAVLTTRDALRSRQTAPAEVSGVSQPLAQVLSGAAAVFADGYDGGWWERQLAWTSSWGGTVPGWASDPLGYYCVAPDYAAGDRLRLVANGRSIDCTIGGEAAAPGVPASGDGVVTLNRASYDALELGGNNTVRVFRLGPASGQRTAAADQIGGGAAAFYDSSYDVAWWESTMSRYSGWGGAVPGWSVDPNGFYCVRPGYQVGQRLRLVANGVTLDCTIGDTVQQQHLAMWQSRWAVEMSWDTFVALGLPGDNSVEVFALR